MDYYIDKNNIKELCRIISVDLDVPLNSFIVDDQLTKFGVIILVSFLVSCTYRLIATCDYYKLNKSVKKN